MKNIRLILYATLQLSDVLAILAAFYLTGLLRDDKWLSPQGYHIVYLVVPIFLLFAYSRESYSIDSLRSLSESLRRPLSALCITALVTLMFAFFSKSGSDVSRLAFGLAFSGSFCFMALGRLAVDRLIYWQWQGNVIDQIIILDGVAPFAACKDILCIDARKERLYPDPMDPHKLSHLSALVKGYDRVIVACSDERQHDWALFLKGSDIPGELIVSQHQQTWCHRDR